MWPGQTIAVLGAADRAEHPCDLPTVHPPLTNPLPPSLEIAEVVRELAQRFTIVECSFDPWRAGQIGQELEQRGIRVSAFPQHDARMVPASQRLYDAIVERRLVHGNDPQLNAHVATAVARHGRRGWRIDKTNRSDKIDGAISLCMALDRLENRPAPAQVIGWL